VRPGPVCRDIKPGNIIITGTRSARTRRIDGITHVDRERAGAGCGSRDPAAGRRRDADRAGRACVYAARSRVDRFGCLNPGYFEELDRRVAYANSRGLVVGLGVAWGDKRKVEPYAWRRLPGVAARKRYARYIASRYSAYDVYFLVSGEWHAEVRTDRQEWVVVVTKR
jgi:hypothetical protein